MKAVLKAKEYIGNLGKLCPHCSSDKVYVRDQENTEDGFSAEGSIPTTLLFREMGCGFCGRRWDEEWNVVNITDLDSDFDSDEMIKRAKEVKEGYRG